MKDAIERSSAFTLAGTWEPLETHAGQEFRWVSDAAEFVVAVLRRCEYRVDITLEAGPHGGPTPVAIEIVDVATGSIVKAAAIGGRRAIAFSIDSGEPRVLRYRVRAPQSVRATEGRTLAFRVFAIDIRPLPGDVVPQAAGFVVGRDWDRIETFNGEHFRWASRDVYVEAREDARFPLVLELEGGPSLGSEARLDVVDDATGAVLTSSEVGGRRRLVVERGSLELPAILRLRVVGGDNKMPDDPRILNFRALEAPTTP